MANNYKFLRDDVAEATTLNYLPLATATYSVGDALEWDSSNSNYKGTTTLANVKATCAFAGTVATAGEKKPCIVALPSQVYLSGGSELRIK